MAIKILEYERDALPASLRRAVRHLREESEPGSQWKHRVMREIANRDRPRAVARRWTMRPLTAVAAGLACVLLGSAVTAVLSRSPVPGSRSAAFPASSASQVRFTLAAPGAASVVLVGDFNGWNPRALPMRRSVDGQTWEVEVPLAPGRYTYSFIVDGVLERDPRAPRVSDDDFGTPSSVVLVRGS